MFTVESLEILVLTSSGQVKQSRKSGFVTSCARYDMMHMFKPGDLVVLQLPGSEIKLEPPPSAIGIVVSISNTNWRGSVIRSADIIWSGNNLTKEVPTSYLELYKSCD